MATVDGITVAKAQEIEGKTIASATVNGSSELIITLVDNTTINAGNVSGALNSHINDNTGVHGVGTVVGTTETQTLSGKTLNSPTLVTPTIASFVNASHDHDSAASGGWINQIVAKVTKSGVQVLQDQNWEHIFWQTETSDTFGFHSTSAGIANAKFTAPSGYGGRWFRTTFQAHYQGNATGRRTIAISKGGTDLDPNVGSSEVVAYSNWEPGNTLSAISQITGIVYLADGDYVRAHAWQNSGGALDFETGYSWFTIEAI